MTGRLQLIEQKLIAIDSAGFQNLCDAYLLLRETEYNSFNRTGSQLGKQKTIKGTPDGFIRFADNKLAYIEYTTQEKALTAKIIEDIEKCLDSSKTGIDNSNLHKLILCFNSRLSIAEESQIQAHAISKNIRVELIGIDTLAIEIMSKYVILSRDFLGIPIDTGQILLFDKFISEYNNKAHQLSTSLDNIFLHRAKELDEITNSLQTKDLIILSGVAGVGKTKIGLEGVNKFLEANPSFQAFSITKKDVDIYDDLRIQLQVDKDYILLIDDANRQMPNLNQILGIFKEERKGKLKIVITVRNYAFSDVDRLCYELDYQTITIPKFTDDEIIKILESDSFKILNSEYQKKIVSLADGNARLAIMCARLANEKQVEFLRGDVTDLFDIYFGTFVKDFDLFENPTLLKTLAIISFFFTINRDNKGFTTKILELFNIDYYEFNESIEELHKRELIEVQYNHARISEQVMATYFFYKVFIKDELLSFKILLLNFFEESKSRFKDSIIPANNSFGYDNVFSKINNTLDEYLTVHQNDEKTTLDFLDLFWFYKQEATISYFYNKVSSLPELINPKYLTTYETNDFVFNKEKILDFITRFYDYPTKWLNSSIELGFEYIRKQPKHLPEFIRRIREHLLFDKPDEQTGFQRQVEFIDILVSNVQKGKIHYITAFFAIAKTFLQHTFQNTHGGRRHSFTTYEYPIPLYEVTEKVRTKIWQTLFDMYDAYPEEVFDVIREFKPMHHNLIPEVMDFDLNLLVPFIRTKFSPSNFKHTYLIQDMISRNNREEQISNREYQTLKELFTSQEYIDFCKFDWNRFRDKNVFDFDSKDYREYDRLKAEELKKHFTFSEEKEFDRLFTAIDNKLSLKEGNCFSVGQSLDIIVANNFACNNELGFKLLQMLIKRYPRMQLLYKTISTITKSSKEWCVKLWNELENWDGENGQLWRINFFNYVDDKFVDNFFRCKLMETINRVDKSGSLSIENYSRYRDEHIYKHITKEILQITSDKIANQKIYVAYSDHIFENLDFFEFDYELIKLSYFQQYRFNHSQIFDFHKKGFFEIFKHNNEFLIDFIREFYINRDFAERNPHLEISFIWDTQKYFSLIEQVCKLIIENNPYCGVFEHPIEILFSNLQNEQQENASIFIKSQIEKNKDNTQTLNIIFTMVRHCLNDRLEELMLLYLSMDPNIENFKQISWISQSATMSGEGNFGEILEKRWERILEIVDKSPNTLAMIPIKAYLQKRILSELKSAEDERMRKFLTPDW